MSNIFFQPFVGKDYASGGLFGKRIVILGESHYCDEGCVDCGNCSRHRECMNFTQNVVQTYLDKDDGHENWMNTFLKFERSLVGRETDREESKYFCRFYWFAHIFLLITTTNRNLQIFLCLLEACASFKINENLVKLGISEFCTTKLFQFLVIVFL